MAVTLNNSARFDLAGQPETIQTIQSTSPNASITNVDGILTVAPSAGGSYNGGIGVSDFAGSISGDGTFRMNGTLEADTAPLPNLTVTPSEYFVADVEEVLGKGALSLLS